MFNINDIARFITEDPDIFNDIEGTEAPVKPQAPTKPKPDTRPWNPPRPKEQPAPKADTETDVPTKAPTKPKPDVKPWNPPRPKEDPSPKAQFLTEDYEDEVNPRTQEFWGGIRSGRHIFQKHPILAMYGQESVKKAFQDNIDKLSRAFPDLARLSPKKRLRAIYHKTIGLFTQVAQLERRFRPQLEQIAKETVSEVYGIPIEALDAKLGGNPSSMMSGGGKPEEVEYQEYEPDRELRDQINKRITLNVLTQGAAVHNMMSVYNLAANKINDLNPRLLEIYKQLSPGMLSPYWLTDYIAIASTLKDIVVGAVQVKYPDNQDAMEYDEEEEFDDEYEDNQASEEYNGPIIQAVGMNFPVLIQELVKGAMEVLSHHGLSDLDQQTTRRVLDAADVLTDEPWLIQVGPHIWRSFLKIVPKKSDLATIVAKLATKDPKFIHDLLSQTLEDLHQERDPAEQRQIMQDMMDDIEEYTGEDLDDIL